MLQISQIEFAGWPNNITSTVQNTGSETVITVDPSQTTATGSYSVKAWFNIDDSAATPSIVYKDYLTGMNPYLIEVRLARAHLSRGLNVVGGSLELPSSSLMSWVSLFVGGRRLR